MSASSDLGKLNADYWKNRQKYDLSGIHIKSHYPIAVFSGNYRTSIPTSKNSRDHLVEQLLPTLTWGHNYVMLLICGGNKSCENYYSVLALDHDTVIYFGNDTNATLSAGEFIVNLLFLD